MKKREKRLPGVGSEGAGRSMKPRTLDDDPARYCYRTEQMEMFE
jgi:hypothetical protein